MAQITPLFKKNFARPCGYIIHDLLMPDGSRRAYKAMGKNAIAKILVRYPALTSQEAGLLFTG